MVAKINFPNTRNIYFGLNRQEVLKKQQFKKFFGENAEFQKLTDTKALSKLAIFKNINALEVLKFKRNTMKYLFDDGTREFFPVIEGKKPAGFMSSASSLKYLDKGAYEQEIEFVHLKPTNDGIFNRTHYAYVLNKKEVFKIIERNKDIYTNRLGLSDEASTEEIYTELKKILQNDKSPENYDIIGITLGIPRQSSIIYTIEHCVGMNYRDRTNPSLYKSKMLRSFNSKGFPYKNFSTTQIEELREIVENIENITTFNNAIYDFIKYVEEPMEMKRINESAEEYVKGFKLNLLT